MSYQFIESKTELNKAVELMEQSKSLAIDLEFDKNMYRYGFNMCLMQVKTPEACLLIDPLSEKIDIKTTFPALQNPEVEKVVFAFGEDLRLLHSLGCIPQNLYDLSMASSLLNYETLSLTNLTELVLGVQVRKSAQRSNWFTRPLTQIQLNYAADDVLYLHQLKDVFEETASKKGIAEWIKQENEVFNHVRYGEVENNVLYRDKDKFGLSEARWFVYKKIIDYRETLAQKANRPGYQIIDKEYIHALAKDFNALRRWHQAHVMPSFKTPEIKEALQQLLDTSMAKALATGLSDTKNAIEKLGREEYLALRKEKQLIEETKNNIFKPLKQKIAENYGEHTAAFMLSSRSMETIISGYANTLPAYRIELLKQYAEELDLNVSAYF